MKLTEKIANAKQRINELEQLIKYWDNSDKEREESTKLTEMVVEDNNDIVAA